MRAPAGTPASAAPCGHLRCGRDAWPAASRTRWPGLRHRPCSHRCGRPQARAGPREAVGQGPVGSVVPTRPDSAVASSSGWRRQLGAPCPGFHMPTLTLVGRSGPDGDVDRVELRCGRWAQKPGEIVPGASFWPLRRDRLHLQGVGQLARGVGPFFKGNGCSRPTRCRHSYTGGIGISGARLCRVLVSRVCVVVAVGDSVCSVRLVRELFKPAGPSSVSSPAEGCL